MKRMLLVCTLLAISLFFVAGCGGKRYIIVTDDYAIHETQDKPVINADTNTISYKDKDGKQVSIPRDSMKAMHEVD